MSELTIEFNRIKQETYNQGMEKGVKTGIDQGIDQGEKKGLMRAVRGFCDLLAIPLDPERQARLNTMDGQQLSDLCAHIQLHRAWPET